MTDEIKEPYMNEFGGAMLNPERTSIVLDRMGRTWSKCKGCRRHYSTEDWPIQCPACKLEYGREPEKKDGERR